MTYKELLRHAKRINSEYYVDIAHDLLVRHYEKGRDLLDGTYNYSFIYQALRWQATRTLNKGRYVIDQSNGERVLHYFENVEDLRIAITPDTFGMIALNEIQQVVEHNAGQTKYFDVFMQLFKLLPDGYSIKEMSEIMNINRDSVYKRRLQILSWLDSGYKERFLEVRRKSVQTVTQIRKRKKNGIHQEPICGIKS
jgi:hypothetical protein